jgi:hypothetical protein
LGLPSAQISNHSQLSPSSMNEESSKKFIPA